MQKLPKRRRRVGRPDERLKWTVERGAAEFGKNPRTLTTRLRQLGIDPCYDGQYYSTAQMAQAVFGDLEAERIRETKENADKLALQNAKSRKELVPSESVVLYHAGLIVTLKQIVKHSSLSTVEKQECYRQLQELRLEDVFTAGGLGGVDNDSSSDHSGGA